MAVSLLASVDAAILNAEAARLLEGLVFDLKTFPPVILLFGHRTSQEASGALSSNQRY